MIERSNPACSNSCGGEFMQPADDGFYVDWDDYADLQRRCAELEKANAELRERCGENEG